MMMPTEQRVKVQKQAERLQYIWPFLASTLGLGRDTVVELKHENKTPTEQAMAMLKLAMADKNLTTIKERFGRWDISEDQIRLIAKQLPSQCLTELAEAVCVDCSSYSHNTDPIRSLLLDMAKKNLLGGNGYSWNVVNSFINKAKIKADSTVKPGTENQNEQIRQMSLDLQLAAQREAVLQIEVDNPKIDNTLRADLEALRKSMLTIQETLDSLVVAIRYQNPPAQNPASLATENSYNPRFQLRDSR